MFRYLVLLAILTFSQSVGASPVAAQHGKIDLVAEQGSLAPGHSIRLGLLFDLEPGWHIYWENPGDSGEPPRVEWKLPAGFRAEEIEWPSPVRLGKPPVVNYGYEGRALLILRVRAPANLRAGGEATLAAHVKWLICREICIPEQAEVSLTLPVRRGAPKAAAGSQTLFAEASKLLPKPLPPGWKAEARSTKESFVLTLRTGARVAEATFFPLEADQIENASPRKTEALAHGVRLTLAKSEQLLKPVASLRGVIVLGPGRAYRIVAPVRSRK
jgi:DsbC/DsbD-like thiol-disulfide interchange protein